MACKIAQTLPVFLFMIAAAVLIDLSQNSPAYAADRAISRVLVVDRGKREVQVSNPKGGSFKIGERLSLRLDGQVVVLRVTAPMSSLSRCVIEKGGERLDKVAKGMFVYRGIVKAEEEAVPVETAVFAGIEMVLVPSDGIMPSFYIGKFEVTQKQYEDITGKNPSQFRSKPDHPVENLSWYLAVEFCNRLSRKAGFTPYYNIDKKKKDPDNRNPYDLEKWTVTINKGSNGFRLPASAEWEYACRAGTRSRYYWGDRDDFNTVNPYAVYKENSARKGYGHADYGPNAVGGKKPNAWGLHDMAGNVFEWCFDWSLKYPGVSRAMGGGSWFHDAGFMRSGNPSWSVADRGADSIGMRLVKNP